jgi:homoserine O-acetyltransferase
VTAHAVFEAEIELERGGTLPAQLAYATYGTLAPDGANVVVFPTRYGGRHEDNEFMIGPEHALDPERWFVVVPNLLGNGVSTSPSNAPAPFAGGRFPQVTIRDNVLLQHRLLTEGLGVERVALAVGWSMGAQQAYEWATSFPSTVERLLAICGAARTSVHNAVFLEGMRAALEADSALRTGGVPAAGLRAIGRAWAAWPFSQEWYRRELYRELGYATVEQYLAGHWDAVYLKRDPWNVLAQLWTWQHADVAANPAYGGDLARALGAIEARAIVMPAEHDLYFPPQDSAAEVACLRHGELRPIPSVWGHWAGGGHDRDATALIDGALLELLR